MKTIYSLTLAAALLTWSTSGSAQTTRDWRTWPFASDSPWNHPIGSGAQYDYVPNLNTLPIGINYADAYTTSVKIAKDTDPLVKLYVNTQYPKTNWSFLYWGGGKVCGNTLTDEQYIRSLATQTLVYPANTYSTLSTPDDSLWLLPTDYNKASQNMSWTFRLPTGSCPSPDADGHMAVFQPNGWVLETYATVVLSNGDTVSDRLASYTNAKGQGTGWDNGRKASMIPNFAGLIRNGEISSGRIPHALVATIPASLLTEKAVWPASAFDRNSGYTGTLPMGSLLAIPANVDVNNIGLSARGVILARAAQDYGIYVADRGGGGMTLQAELGNTEIRWTNASNDLNIIVRNLKVISNNGPNNRGGGGVPRAPFAPPFYDDVATAPTPTPTPAPAPAPAPAPTDVTAPSVAITSPVNGATAARNSTIQITANASDDVHVAKVEFYVNGALKCTDTAPPFSCDYRLSKKPGVTYRFQAKGFDSSGNTGWSSTVSITSK